MGIVKSEFALALNQVATERGISPEEVMQSIEAAIIAAYKKEYPTEETDVFTVLIGKNTGETKIMKDGIDITPPGFGRIAAQTARQVILQKIREAEKKTIFSQYKNLSHTLVKGRIIRYDGYNAFVDIGKTEAVLPKEEQIRNEHYSVNTSLTFFLKDIQEDKTGRTRIVVSRSHPDLILELFKREVPEIASGAVLIKKVVRDPGERAKIAVASKQSGIDPVGACVGQKGIRVQTVTEELGGQEKIDIIAWNDNVKLFLVSALAPAKIISVDIDEATKHAIVTVEESQAPLAIGRGGVNVNLAAQLCDLQVDIKQIKSEQPAAVPAPVNTVPEQSKESPTETPAKPAEQPNTEDKK